MNERLPVPPSRSAARTSVAEEGVPETPCVVPAATRDRETRADSISRLLEALAEYERTVALLLTTVLGLCLPGRDQGMRDTDGSRAKSKGKEKCPDG